MKQAVAKLGGSILGGTRDAAAVLDIIRGYEGPLVAVVSALKGVTDALAAAAEGKGPPPGALIARLKAEHLGFAEALGAPSAALEAASLRIELILRGLGVLLGAPRGASDARRRAEILATGERLSATCVALAFAALGRPAPIVEPRELGLVAADSPSGPRVDVEAAGPSIRAALADLRDAVVPGFYGVDAEGGTVLFGRGGSDYSAAIVAAGLGASRCDLVKDVSGLLTADPVIVPGARRVRELSYAEAEALARGGAKVLHQLTVEPLREAGIALRIVGREASEWETRIGPRLRSSEGARAIALAPGPAGSARLTVACSGWAAKSAAAVIGALEARGVAARALSMGPEGASFSVIVDGSRGEDGLKIAHEVLFEGGLRAERAYAGAGRAQAGLAEAGLAEAGRAQAGHAEAGRAQAGLALNPGVA